MNPTKILALALLLATPALADETWMAAEGDVTYLADVGSTAVLGFTLDGHPARLYVPGLAGNADHRGVHDAYWIAQGATTTCDAGMGAPDGFTSQSWGRATVVFDVPTFPTGFTALLGDCLADPARPLRADLR